ncbi:hypothetical protein F4859DRAFT_525094 [Xylaria cf. heliscus]|nr:hypothetical protein F4859DRAFT_525094 [Xylaria cf. heliscus]
MVEYGLIAPKVNNDAVWEALQPALRLVSMVLDKNHPHLEAIINMNTRQPIPPNADDVGGNYPPTLTKYVLEEDIDMSKTYPAIRQLKEVHNYNWKANVLRVLERTLVLELDSGYTLGMSHVITESVSDDTHTDFFLGSCATHRRYGPPGVVPPSDVLIKVRLAADVVWPLLVPQYSKSEKMACSFTVASTLLHEFAVCISFSPVIRGLARELANHDIEAHAVNQAQELLTTREFGQLPGQDPEVARLLASLDGVVWDIGFGEHQEPFFEQSGIEELGQEFEHSLWGHSTNLPGGAEGLSRHHNSIVFALGEETHPAGEGNTRTDAVFPMMRYMRPIPLDYIAKLFSKTFWKEEFGAYGFGAMRMMPDGLVQKNLMYEPVIPDRGMDTDLYGVDRARFLVAVPRILLKSRQYVLGTYLNALRMEIAYRAQYERWWVTEVENWEEELLHPLEGSIELLDIELSKTRDLNLWHRASVADKVSYYGHYRNTKNPDDPDMMTYADWQDDVIEKWKEMLKYGGWLMQRLLVVHTHMQDDIGNLQRMTFYFLAVKPPNTQMLLRDQNDGYTLPGVLYARLEAFRSHARRITGMINYLGSLAQLATNKDKWDQWEARFKACGEKYNELMLMLREGTKIDSDPFDVSWKVRFDRLPTGNWKHVSEIYKKMAFREYARADPAVRETIDDFLSSYTNLNLINTTAVNTRVGKIGRVLKSMTSIGQKGARRGANTIFDFFPPPRPSARAPPPPPEPPKPPPALPVPVPTSGYIFGVPSLPTGAAASDSAPPRRVTRVQKPQSTARRSAAYRSYVTNLLTTPDPGLASGAAADLFKAGVPQPILDILPSRKPLAGGSGRTPIPPFPNPYASRAVMTSVDAEFQERKELSEKARRSVERAGGAYVAPSLWRENTWDWENDKDVKMGGMDDV